MPRDANGNYTLPAGNPVVTNTTIDSAWANPTMSDIGNELTNSLDRSGRGGMLAPLTFIDGSVNQPGIGFTNEPTMGFFRDGAGNLTVAVGNVRRVLFNDVEILSVFRNGAYARVPDVTSDETINGIWTFTQGLDVPIVGGSIDDTPIGATIPSTGAFTTLTADSLDGATIGATVPSTGDFTVLTADSLDDTPIGATTPSTGAFTTLTSGAITSSSVVITGGTINGTTIGATTPATGSFTEVLLGNGLINDPSLSFAAEPSMGLYRPGSNIAEFVIAGAGVARFHIANKLQVFRDAVWKNVADESQLGGGGGRLVKTTSFIANATWTPHADTLLIRVILVAGGGGGGGAGTTAATNPAAAGGGGGGGTVDTLLTSLFGASEAITVGVGGLGGIGVSTGSNPGGVGGSSSFGALATATGGQGGVAAIAHPALQVQGGSAGGLGSGITGLLYTGGASGNTLASGNSVVPGVYTAGAGCGGDSAFGGGANAVARFGGTGAVAGIVGGTYGGGGSGAIIQGITGNVNGAAGGAGLVIVEEYA